MSSNLTNFVPVLDNSNYTSWAPMMESWLQAQGLWKVVTCWSRCEDLEEEKDKSGKVTNQSDIDAVEDDQDKWDDMSEKAMGSIQLRLLPAITQVVKGETTAKDMWMALKEAHTVKTLGNAYTEFKGLFNLLAEFHVPIQPYLALMLFSITMMSTELVDLNKKASKGVRTGTSASAVLSANEDKNKVDIENLYKVLQATWKQRKLRPKQRAINAQRATGIKRKGNNPQFSQQQGQQQSKPKGNNQQQNQQQQNSEKKKRMRGKKGGKGKERKDTGHGHLAGATFTYVPPPPVAVNLKPVLESRLEPDRLVSKGKNQYPRTRKLMNLLERLEVPTTYECVCALEEVVEATAPNRSRPSASIVEVKEPEFVEGSTRPRKRVRITSKRINWAEEVEAQEAADRLAQEDNAISLGTASDVTHVNYGENPNRGDDVNDDLFDAIGYYADESRMDDSE
ncbi:hypothetical protein PHLGIDRAFT_122818 [Phlebiopsis gigantea 11061_1 CR5-6]|uniref:Uncharacterized protein n=1 Tax=Phlebiopsis gigantea (strain 11061_1 CR5-6) TaxID=745531 RepID=A0A0C3RZS7_PHLG1|nr:hypothetical protein PHLGIDRAFT_122818 [Phlebiopsis gigantea 11061_1 CR5-6]